MREGRRTATPSKETRTAHGDDGLFAVGSPVTHWSVQTSSGRHRRPAGWACLVPPGLLHSGCEEVEHWALPQGAVLTATPRRGVEEALLVLGGAVLL